MCLAIPVRIVELHPPTQATVEVGGVRTVISLAMVDNVAVGDYVIVHAGFALTRLNVEEAEKSLALFQEIAAQLGPA